MIYKGFIGPAYRSQSRAVSADELFNLYPEKVDAANPKSPVVFYGTPGLKTFLTLDDFPVRALFQQDGRAFAVGGGYFNEIFADGTFIRRGIVSRTADNLPATIASNSQQLMIASGEGGWIYDLHSDTLSPIEGDFLGSTQCAFQDGYFLGLVPRNRVFGISGLYDGLKWSGLDFAAKEGTSENLVGFFVDHRQLWLFGSKTTEVFWNTGNPDFAFERIQGALMQVGLGAQFSVASDGTSILWLAADERGRAIAYRNQGYSPQRISTHAVEFAWQQYAKMSDAIGWTEQDQGHTFYFLYFPTGDATWVFDLATGLWHQRAWLDNLGVLHAHRARCHMSAFGKHLVGDRETGAIYEQSLDFFDDAGVAIRRQRTAPVIQAENKYIFYHQLELLIEQGVTPGGGAQGDPPTMVLQASNDGGFTWGNEIQAKGGKLGQYQARCIWRRLGRARQRAFRVFSTDPIRHAWVDAFIELTPGNGA